MSERNGVEIDYCPQCRGVWLDRGELDKIIERSAQVEAQYESRESVRDGGDEPRDRDQGSERHGSEPRRKKSSFLGQLFEGIGGED